MGNLYNSLSYNATRSPTLNNLKLASNDCSNITTILDSGDSTLTTILTINVLAAYVKSIPATLTKSLYATNDSFR